MPVLTASSTKVNYPAFAREDIAIKIPFCRAKEIQFFNAKAQRELARRWCAGGRAQAPTTGKRPLK
jgi:hypothetical protein